VVVGVTIASLCFYFNVKKEMVFCWTFFEILLLSSVDFGS
jgi:hypothetical protein